MGLGGLNSKILFLVEDTIFSKNKFQPIPALLNQWPELEQLVTLMPVNGVEKLPNPELLETFVKDAGLNCPVMLHRDRDFMSDDEVTRWKENFDDLENVTAWVTDKWDADWYFTQKEHLAAVYGVSLEEASGIIAEAIAKITEKLERARAASREHFNNLHRKLYAKQGSPSVDNIYAQFGGDEHSGAHGTKLLSAVKEVINGRGLNASLIYLPTGQFELGLDLKTAIQEALQD